MRQKALDKAITAGQRIIDGLRDSDIADEFGYAIWNKIAEDRNYRYSIAVDIFKAFKGDATPDEIEYLQENA